VRAVLLPLLAAAVLLATAAPAGAATPTVVGTGADPGLAVDGSGTAYLAWNGTETSGTRSLHFCRLARGAKACSGAPAIAVPDGTYSLYRPFVTVSGGTVQITQSRYGFPAGSFSQVVQFTSSDGGNTWSAGTSVGTITFNAAVTGPGGAVSAVTFATTGGGSFQTMAPGNTASALLSADHPYDGAVGVTPAGQLIAIFDDGSSNAQFRLHNGGNSNDASTWGPPVDIGVERYPRLAGGPSGLFLLGDDAGGRLEVRKWTGSTFGSPTDVGAGGEAAQADLFQDGGGRLHAVWPTFEVDGIALRHAASDDGRHWEQKVLVTQSDGEPTEVRVAAAPDHVGVAVWVTQSQIRLLAVRPSGPVFHKTVVVKPLRGKVLVKRPGSKRFKRLRAGGSLPLGTSVDVRRGRIALSAASSKHGRARTVRLYSGRFKVTQPGKITQFALNGPLAGRGKGASAARKKTRRLWGDGKGRFRTRGRFSSATVRGTKWLVQDSCGSTVTKVARGVVTVRDFARHKTVKVRAGHSYTARR
jgi:hypothetical protein